MRTRVKSQLQFSKRSRDRGSNLGPGDQEFNALPTGLYTSCRGRVCEIIIQVIFSLVMTPVHVEMFFAICASHYQ